MPGWSLGLVAVMAACAAGCLTGLDCSGGNGACRSGGCVCKPGWQGPTCERVRFGNSSGRVAYSSPLWTWGGSPIVDPADGRVHLFSSVMSEHCGIMHYCLNSYVAHLSAPNSTGPFEMHGPALLPRPGAWDNGAIHGVSAHRLPNGSFALFYMGSMQPGLRSHPNCTPGSGDPTANSTTGSHNGRRIGVALSEQLSGPWRRLDRPLLGPDPSSWDNIDVSNPSPIIHNNGSVVMLYKGRGSRLQHMGLAFAPSIDGPYIRNASGKAPPDLPGEDPWGWIDTGGVYHALFHEGNGAGSAGSHRWSLDGVVWHGSDEPAYTGVIDWAPDTLPGYAGKRTVLARRERPQILLDGPAGSSYGEPLVLFTSGEDCYPSRGQPDAGSGRLCASGVGTDKSYTVLESINQA